MFLIFVSIFVPFLSCYRENAKHGIFRFSATSERATLISTLTLNIKKENCEIQFQSIWLEPIRNQTLVLPF